jgi:hypothetical protein
MKSKEKRLFAGPFLRSVWFITVFTKSHQYIHSNKEIFIVVEATVQLALQRLEK